MFIQFSQVFSLSRRPLASRPIAGRWASLALAAGLALVCALALSSRPAAAQTLFGYDETENDDIHPFLKWRQALARYFKERALETAPCTESLFERCNMKRWQAFLHKVKKSGRMAQLDAVNRYMNRAAYITDPVNYGVPDYWATPRQFFQKDGDCEDYAIAKYMSLRELGWPVDALRIVVLLDENLKLPHAVLVVRMDGRTYVLDNQIEQVVTDDRIHHYRPIYSINEKAWWLHRKHVRPHQG
jgi:predicted transglutaminase-like cysteine proteinase